MFERKKMKQQLLEEENMKLKQELEDVKLKLAQLINHIHRVIHPN